ncbi:MAG TPA: DUF1002 domain-containing protein [Thermomicrobiales bacterium]|jgi:uncharacterized protein YpuA (DUF1002 family)
MNPRVGERRRRSLAEALRIVSWSALALAAVAALAFGSPLSAKTTKTITLGESLNDDQKRELLEYFKAGADDKVITITEKETNDAMAGVLDGVGEGMSGAYSSTALTCRELGDGLDVTTRSITLVTPSMYAMALVTAGIGDARLVVAAPELAPAGGMAALTGVFKTWEIAPCESGKTTKKRQKLALEELALTSQIGQALVGQGIADGIQRASDLVLDTQKTIVTDRLSEESAIESALAGQEQAQAVTVPPDLRPKLVDLMVRLVDAKIDWSTFSAGWEIKRNSDNTRITMTGDGIAVRHARQTATAEAAAAMTATAEAAAGLTATAAAEVALTATANAQMTATANAQATQQAIAALTATAAAQPTVTPTPQPTATPSPFSVSGTVDEVRPEEIVLRPAGGGDQPATYRVRAGAAIVRDGKPTTLAKIGRGDTVTLTIEGSSHLVTGVDAQAAPGRGLAGFWWVPILPLVVGVFVLRLGRLRAEEPFIVKRVPA